MASHRLSSRELAALERVEMRDEWIAALRSWASKNDSIAELWLFGSRAKNTARPESDIDVAIALMPPTGRTNWALADYVYHFEEWKAELREALGWPISLTAIGRDCDLDAEVRTTGLCLWRRGTEFSIDD